MDNNTIYKFGGNQISKDQHGTLMQIAMLGKAGILDSHSAKSLIGQTLLQKPDPTQELTKLLLSDQSNPVTTPAPSPNPLTLNNNSNVNPPEEQGHPGLGVGKGELFGEGGFISSLTQPVRQGIIDPVVSAMQSIFKGGLNTGPQVDHDKVKALTDQATELFRKGDHIRGNALLNQAKAILQPALNVAGTGAGDVNNAIENQAGTTGLPSILGGVSQQEHNDYMKNPLVGGLKSGAAILSYGIPVGSASSLAGNLGLGATAGTLFGAGTARPGEELQGGVTGAVGGTAGAGISEVGGKIFGKIFGKGAAEEGNILTKAGQDLQNSIVGVEPGLKNGIKTPELANQINADTINLLKENKLIGNTFTKNDVLNGVQELLTKKGEALNPLLENSGVHFNADQIGNQFAEHPEILNYPHRIESNDFKGVLKDFQGLGQNPSAADLNNFKLNTLDPKINYNPAGDVQSNNYQTALKAFRDTIDSALKDPALADLNPHMAEANQILQDMSTLHHAQNAALTSGDGAMAVKIPGGPRVGLSGNITSKAKTMAGSLLQNAGKISAIPNGIPSLSSILGAQGASAVSKPQAMTNLQDSPNPLIPDTLPTDTINIPGLKESKALAAQLMQVGYNESQIKNVFALKGMPNPFTSISPGQRLKVQQTAAAYNKVTDLIGQVKKNSDQFGTIAGGPVGNTLNIFNAGNRNALKQNIKAIAAEVTKITGNKNIADQIDMQQDPQTIIDSLRQIQGDIYDRYNVMLDANQSGSTLTIQ